MQESDLISLLYVKLIVNDKNILQFTIEHPAYTWIYSGLYPAQQVTSLPTCFHNVCGLQFQAVLYL